ncbi:16S rRNA (adenine(1518)-N(6)/adenine(1519)-N(6))-dimethyltransferase RsmA [Acidithrix sp. C25]|uniref:16S rRNA (adenine(1518)-N(6)/adenine(1519)-N(6))- dimethyltransferase RsmA n=1 Tax=Acidithrix sp. C25 TaxID=1671482 RepID=UPI00191B9C47|nr:16S rRNA (adenine(1518)-N(6)/adenine(1519)-N(6))-dimethyltransferase RsmA [Acidithrix sp. C25]CAG4926594.1 unnamed protein product [Acidithrix sp. C25]
MNIKDVGITKSEIAALLGDASLSPKRSLGQNFLIDSSVATAIARLADPDGRRIFEIGPGLGSLTVFLATLGQDVVVLEKDEKIAESLQKVLARREISNVEVINGDALLFDILGYCDDRQIRTVAGNLPYNISVPLILSLVERPSSLESLSFLVQKEVAHRLCAVPGGKNCSFVSLKLAVYCDSKVELDVSNDAFVPKPNITSSVIVLKPTSRNVSRYSSGAIDIAFSIARIGFSHRRQMLRRNLTDPMIRAGMVALEISQEKRAEEVTTTQWLDLGDWLARQGYQGPENGVVDQQ